MLDERYIVAHASAIDPKFYNEKFVTMYGTNTYVLWDSKKNKVIAATDHYDEITLLKNTANKLNEEYKEELVYLDMIYKYVHG